MGAPCSTCKLFSSSSGYAKEKKKKAMGKNQLVSEFPLIEHPEWLQSSQKINRGLTVFRWMYFQLLNSHVPLGMEIFVANTPLHYSLAVALLKHRAFCLVASILQGLGRDKRKAGAESFLLGAIMPPVLTSTLGMWLTVQSHIINDSWGAPPRSPASVGHSFSQIPEVFDCCRFIAETQCGSGTLQKGASSPKNRLRFWFQWLADQGYQVLSTYCNSEQLQGAPQFQSSPGGWLRARLQPHLSPISLCSILLPLFTHSCPL